MKQLLTKLKGVVCAALAMGLALGAQAADVAVAVKSTDEKTLTFYYKDASETNQLQGTVYVVPETAEKGMDIPWYLTNNNPITNVVFDASFANYRPKSTVCWFQQFTALTGITKIQCLNTSSVTSMSSMFYGCTALTALDVSGFDTANVTNMHSMFWSCTVLTALDVSGFDTTNVTSMVSMFSKCSSLTSLDVSNFNTTNVTSMANMFSKCSSLTSLDVSNFNTANVTSMSSMFNGCTALTSLDVSNFDTANVTSMSSMFQECTDLTTICASDAFKTNQVTNSKNMFNSSTALVGGNGTKWTDANPKDMTYARIDGVNGLPGYFTRGKTAITIADVTGATAQVYTNDTVEIAGPPYKVLVDATDVKVVYTAADNYMFPGGYKTFTTNVTATGAKMTVTLAAKQQPIDAVANPNCLTFSAADDFGIKMWNAGSPTVNPSLEYSTDQIYWETFNKDDGAAANAEHKLYLRGTGNTGTGSGTAAYYVFTNTSDSVAAAIACSGNIETLLDYKTVEAGNHPTMGRNAFANLFRGFEALTTSPELPATNLADYCYDCMFAGCTSLVVNTNAPGKAWSIPAEAAASAETAEDWNADMFKGTPGDITNTTVTCGVTYYVASAFEPVTVVLPEVAGATAQLLAFKVNGGWASIATNEVPSNATVRVVWTAEDGKAFENGVYVWSRELKATESVQTAPAPAEPTAWSGSESSVTLNIDTRTVKKYFEKDDILPIWYAAGEEVKVKGEGEQSWETLVKSSATTNTLAWVPAEQGTYNFSQNGFDAAQIIYTTPVEVTTNDLEVSGTTVAVTADGSPIEPQTEGTYAGRLMVASNSVVTAMWTATGSDVCFMDGTKTYTQTFEASKSVNQVSEAVTKPEEPKTPKLKLGVVAQRYPWDGKIDVQYWAQNTPNTGYEITITITLPDGTTASEKKDCLSGKNWTTFDARAAFGEVQFKSGVKVKATLRKAE